MRLRDVGLQGRARTLLRRALWALEHDQDFSEVDWGEAIPRSFDPDDVEARVRRISASDLAAIAASTTELALIEDALADRGLRLKGRRCPSPGQVLCPPRLMEAVVRGDRDALAVLRDWALETGMVDDWLRALSTAWADQQEREPARSTEGGRRESDPAPRQEESEIALEASIRRPSRCGERPFDPIFGSPPQRCRRRRGHSGEHQFENIFVETSR